MIVRDVVLVGKADADITEGLIRFLANWIAEKGFTDVRPAAPAGEDRCTDPFQALERAQRLLAETAETGGDLAMLSVALRELRNLV